MTTSGNHVKFGLNPSTKTLVGAIVKFASWSVGTTLIVLNYYGVPVLGNPFSYLVLLLVVAPAVLSILQQEKPNVNLLWIVLSSVSLRLVAPLSEGQLAFMIQSDSKYDFQVAQLIAQTGSLFSGFATNRAVQYVYFPALQLLSVQISAVSALPLYQISRFLPLLITIAIVSIVFKAYSWMLSPRVAAIACFLFAMCYKYNWFDGSYIPETLGILFFVMAFYSVMRSSRSRRGSLVLLFVCSVLLVVVTHLFSSLMLSLALALCYVLFLALRHRRLNCLRLTAMEVLVAQVPFASWLTVVAVGPTLLTIGYGVGYSQSLLNLLTDPLSVLSPSTTGGAALSATGGVPLSLLTILILILGFLLISGGAGLFGIFRAVGALQGRATLPLKLAMSRVMIFCTIAAIFGGLALFGILVPSTFVDIPSRLIPFTYFFWAPAFGVGVFLLIRRFTQMRIPSGWKIRRATLSYMFVLLLLIMPAVSTWALLPQDLQGRVTFDDVQAQNLSAWMFTYGNKRISLVGDPTITLTIASLARQPAIETYGFPDFRIAGALYYGSNVTNRLTSDLASSHPKLYLLVNNEYLPHRYYTVTYYYDSKPPPAEHDVDSSLQGLNSFSALDRIYSSSSVTLYVSSYS